MKLNYTTSIILGGPYAAFGGKDASRGLATFSVTSSDKEYDDLSDLNSMEMDSVKEWEAQFRGKFISKHTLVFCEDYGFKSSDINCIEG